jgi:hypothetical protein
LSKKLAQFLYDYGSSLHDKDVKKKLKKMFKLEEEPDDEEEEE